jgi:LPS sulfotransferase NodH
MLEAEAPKTTRFVILAAPRTGSNLLCTLLNSHPHILCHHEVFNPAGIFYAIEFRNGSLDLGSIEERDQAPLAFLERLWSMPLGNRCVGFKMTRGQNEQVLANVLRDPGVRKIVLKRRNRIKTYVSSLVAERSGQWEVYSDADLIEPRPKVELNLTDLRKNMAANEAYYGEIETALRSCGQDALAVSYEDLESTAEHARLLAYLGVENTSVPLVARSVKQNPTDLKRLVANYDEVLNELQGTELVAELLSSEN